MLEHRYSVQGLSWERNAPVHFLNVSGTRSLRFGNALTTERATSRFFFWAIQRIQELIFSLNEIVAELVCAEAAILGRVCYMNLVSGQRFGKLTAQHRFPGTKRGEWLCTCDCGNQSVVRSTSLRQGITKSCGCLIGEAAKVRNTTHGMVGSPPYSSWQNMLARCHNPNYRDYPRWGGRGIFVCDEWRNSFEKFWEDMKDTYAEGLSIDRKDNNGPYTKENCKWSTRIEQQNNRRNNNLITAFGRTQPLRMWSRETGVGWETIRARLRLGWTPEDAISQPATRKKYYNREKLA